MADDSENTSKTEKPESTKSPEGETRSKRIELWIAIIGGIVTIITALITILPSLLANKDAKSQTEEVSREIQEEPTPEELKLGEGVKESEAVDIQAELTAVLDQAYELKVASLRFVDPVGLEDVYTADALDYRLSTVELAEKENCYWDIKLDRPEEYDFEYIADSSARVTSLRYETRFHYCDGKLVTENSVSGDAYFVRYFLMNDNGHWLIYDTDVSDLPD